jgi:hypothetical protein
MKHELRKCQKIATQEARPHHPDLDSACALLVDAGYARSHTFNYTSL